MFANNKRPKMTSETNDVAMSSEQSKENPVMASSASPSVAVALHPLVIMNISEHHTRTRAQEASSSSKTRVFGAILGKQDGRNIELFNSFELQFDFIEDDVIINMEYYKAKEEQFRQVFKDLDFIGWYTTGSDADENDIKVHRQMCQINESSLFLKLNTSSKTSELPISIFESVIDLVDNEPRLLFVDVPYTLATEEAERIGVDHVARVSSAGNSDISSAAEHLQAQYSAIKMLFNRVKMILEYVKAVKAGQVPMNHEIIRDCRSLCQRLPVIDSLQFQEEFFDQCNDVMLMTFLASITKGCNTANDFINKFNLTYDRLGIGRRMRDVNEFTTMPKEDCLSRRSHHVSLSKLQSPMTTKWLHDNYEISHGVSLPRSSLYSHYLDFCQKNCLESVNAASFGKIIRQTFPTLKTRRLGTRGQSKYHYYGISVKESSPYHDTVYNSTRQSASGFSQTYNRAEMKASAQASSESHSQGSQISGLSNGMLLPDFPIADSIDIHDAVIKDKVKTFLIMYRAHCQRILDTILRANFTEVQHFLLHFWRGMPQHISVILDRKEVIELIASCDNILYKAVSSVLIPGTLQPLPTSLTQAIRQFAKQLCSWLEVSLHHVPARLQDKKISVAKAFSQMLCRQTSLSHLAQAARTVLHSVEPVNQMAEDLNKIDVTNIIEPTLWMSSGNRQRNFKLIYTFFEEFAQLLKQQATVDQYAEWIASLVNRCVIKPSEKEEKSFQSCAQYFLLLWSFVCSKVVQELTLKSAKSFGSFHLLQMLFDDYIFFLLESHAIVSEDLDDGIGEYPILRGRHSEITEFPPLPSMFDDLGQSHAANQKPHTRLINNSNNSYRCSNPADEERNLVNIQAAMTLPGCFTTNRCAGAMTFPYDNSPANGNALYSGNTFEYGTREHRRLEEPGIPYMEDRGSGHFYPGHKHGFEYSGQNTNGPFLTQELERLHMAYGTENLFDKYYLFQRELRT